MKKQLFHWKRIGCLLIMIAMVCTFTACGQADASGDNVNTAGNSTGANIVNIGVTNTLNSLNPLLMDGGEVNKYATGLMFLPLCELTEDMSFEGLLADSITTEDNLTFTVHIDEAATWSDGQPVTAEDVAYTALRIASPVVGNTAMMYYVFEGVGEDGFVEAGAETVAGICAVDEKTVQFTTKNPMSLVTFQNSYARYLMPLPKHIISQYSEDELKTAEWFQRPDVVSGPYMVTEYDADHYISYTANEQYWKGTPKIEKLNIRIVDSSQLYAGLQSGEIDITHHTMSTIPQEDYESIEALENIDVVYGMPVINQSVFIQTQTVTDVRVRQAMLCAINREQILEQLLGGQGEIVDGYLSSASPYYDTSVTPTSYDPERAKELLAEAGWDGSQTLRFYVNSGDSTFVNAASVIVAQWAAVGIKAEIQTVDFATLMSVAGTNEYDILAVQYTYPPVDPYADLAWLMSGEGSWTGYGEESVVTALNSTQTEMNADKLKELYSIVTKKVQEDVPMISAYIISPQGAVNKRLVGAKPSVYGFFNHVHEWEITQ
ncbi:MAG: ABC transporter substrate-binding protein [Lachnospiraceae bacterium]|nr:ABC transporter substrate-binding protein [Lachnospiraceae bacterium]